MLRPFWKPVLVLLGPIWLCLVGAEFYARGYASGHDIDRFSLKWALALAVYALLALALLFVIFRWLYRPTSLEAAKGRWLTLRANLATWRWPLAIGAAALPAFFIFFTPWGALFTTWPTRLLIFLSLLLLSAALLAQEREQLLTMRALLMAGLLQGTLLALAEPFSLVSSYPFSQHWSEGNRLWDYSLLFGRDRYNYPADKEIFALIDQARQGLWGLPFLLPKISIFWVRLWGAILVTIPYALLGYFAFQEGRSKNSIWCLVGLWSLIFLNQGPIYTPLVLSAILVAAARRRSWWVALPLVVLAGHYAGVSRYTWRFAPGIWAFLLTLGDTVIAKGSVAWRDWLKAGTLAIAGIVTEGIYILVGLFEGVFRIQVPVLKNAQAEGGVETLEGLQTAVTKQPLLWYRLLPNDAFPPGILLALALAALPLILLLFLAWRRGIWKTSLWQRLLTAGGLGAFLVVGLVASSKIGGGTDLHNLDMFLVGLVLVAGLAWDAGIGDRLMDWLVTSGRARAMLAAMILIPAVTPALTGLPPDRLGPQQTAIEVQRIQERVACAANHGEVLLMDQRQLLTFGYLDELPLVPEYEKKLVMNEALSSNADYFGAFQADLEVGRFTMILTERQALRYKLVEEDRLGDSLVEENNAWVQWVTEPLLQYYESVADRRAAAIEIFLPIDRDFDC